MSHAATVVDPDCGKSEAELLALPLKSGQHSGKVGKVQS